MSSKYYSLDFKLEAVKRVHQDGERATDVAKELGINLNTLNGWIRRFRQKTASECPFPGSGNLSPEDEKMRRLEKENQDLKEEIEILKKATVYFAKNQK